MIICGYSLKLISLKAKNPNNKIKKFRMIAETGFLIK
jgi:hypothetical protein